MDDGARNRRATRYKIFQPAEMSVGAAPPARVHLLNVSAGGALVYGDSVPPLGTQLTLACGGLHSSARVAWSDGRRFGIQFARPIAEAQVQAILASQAALIAAAPRRLVIE